MGGSVRLRERRHMCEFGPCSRRSRSTAMTSSMPCPHVRPGDASGRIFVLLLALFGSAPAHADCTDSPGPGVDWSGDCEKRRLVLRCADLKNARLTGADIGRSDFGKAHLSGADLTRANLDHARFVE